MKKRVKLLTTIASLCLAVALMAFGVYAAAQSTTTVTSAVSFDVADVYVTVDGWVAVGADVTAAAANTTKYDTMTTFKSYTGEDPMAPVAGTGDPTDATNTWNTDAVTLDLTNQAVAYEITITNDGSSPVVVTVTDTTTEANMKDVTLAANRLTANTGAEGASAAFSSGAQLAPGKTVKYTYAAAIKDTALAASVALNVVFVVTLA